MTADSPIEEGIVNIEIRIDRSGISDEELYQRTRRLADELRQLPHKSVGIVSDQAPVVTGAAQSLQASTQGIVTVAVEPTVLRNLVRTCELTVDKVVDFAGLISRGGVLG